MEKIKSFLHNRAFKTDAYTICKACSLGETPTGPRGALRNSAHTSRLSLFPRASEGAPGSGFPGSEPASDPAFSPASLTSSWARWRSLNAACSPGRNDLPAGAVQGRVTGMRGRKS